MMQFQIAIKHERKTIRLKVEKIAETEITESLKSLPESVTCFAEQPTFNNRKGLKYFPMLLGRPTFKKSFPRSIFFCTLIKYSKIHSSRGPNSQRFYRHFTFYENKKQCQTYSKLSKAQTWRG